MFKPEWGIYDMAVGKEVISTYAGPADINSFEDLGKVSETKTHKIVYSEAEKNLYKLYEKVRGFREDNTIIENQLLEVFLMLQDTYKNDWLLTLELYELAFQKDFSVQKVFLTRLEKLQENTKFTKLIAKGLELIHRKKIQKS